MSRIYQRGRIWYIDYSLNNQRVRKSVGTSKKMAELALKETELQIAKGEFLGVIIDRKITFDVLSNEYLKFSQANKRPMVYKRDRIIIKHLLKTFSGYETKTISAHDLEEYKSIRIADVSPATVNREVTCIKHMFNKAVEWQYLKHNPLLSVKRFKEPPGRLRYLTANEINSLLNVCTNHLKPIVIMALNTGMRKGEILNLQWSDVNLNDRVITIKRSKNNEIRTIPMNDLLYSTLKQLSNGCTNGQPVFTYDGKPLRDIRRSFETACRNAEIEDFRFHDLRHTFASQLVMADVNIRTVQQLMGHKDIRMTMRYSHLSDSHLKNAVKKLENGTNLAQRNFYFFFCLRVRLLVLGLPGKKFTVGNSIVPQGHLPVIVAMISRAAL